MPSWLKWAAMKAAKPIAVKAKKPIVHGSSRALG
jgi:hypothetical protein